MDKQYEQSKELEYAIAITKKQLAAQQLETKEASERVQAANQEGEVRQHAFVHHGIVIHCRPYTTSTRS